MFYESTIILKYLRLYIHLQFFVLANTCCCPVLACGLERTLSSSYIVWMNIRKLFGNQPKQFSYIQFLVYVSRMTLESEIDIYIDGHAPCRICVAKFGVKEKNPNQVRLCNYIAPWWILLARLGEGWRSLREIGTERRWTSCMAPRSSAATCVC